MNYNNSSNNNFFSFKTRSNINNLVKFFYNKFQQVKFV